VAQQALVEVVEVVGREAAQVTLREIHHVAAKQVVALHEIRHEAGTVTLKSVARKAAKVTAVTG
jgi:hypothetical protein